jgi:hypothetical protein
LATRGKLTPNMPNSAEVSAEPIDAASPPLGFSAYDEAFEWFTQEHANPMAAARRAAAIGQDTREEPVSPYAAHRNRDLELTGFGRTRPISGSGGRLGQL